MNERDIQQGLSQNVEDGTVEIVGVDENGELVFRLTEKGEREAEELLRRMGIDPATLKDMTPEEFRRAIGR